MIDTEKLVKDVTRMGNGKYFDGLRKMAWQNYEQADKLYHVTPVRYANRIQVAGLIASQTSKIPRGLGDIIWFFVNDSTGHISDMPSEVANSILFSWVNEKDATLTRCEYALFEIDKAAVKRELVIWDRVGEFCAIGSFGYQGKKIAAKHVRLVGNYQLPIHYRPPHSTTGPAGTVKGLRQHDNQR